MAVVILMAITAVLMAVWWGAAGVRPALRAKCGADGHNVSRLRCGRGSSCAATNCVSDTLTEYACVLSQTALEDVLTLERTDLEMEDGDYATATELEAHKLEVDDKPPMPHNIPGLCTDRVRTQELQQLFNESAHRVGVEIYLRGFSDSLLRAVCRRLGVEPSDRCNGKQKSVEKLTDMIIARLHEIQSGKCPAVGKADSRAPRSRKEDAAGEEKDPPPSVGAGKGKERSKGQKEMTSRYGDGGSADADGNEDVNSDANEGSYAEKHGERKRKRGRERSGDRGVQLKLRSRQADDYHEDSERKGSTHKSRQDRAGKSEQGSRDHNTGRWREKRKGQQKAKRKRLEDEQEMIETGRPSDDRESGGRGDERCEGPHAKAIARAKEQDEERDPSNDGDDDGSFTQGFYAMLQRGASKLTLSASLVDNEADEANVVQEDPEMDAPRAREVGATGGSIEGEGVVTIDDEPERAAIITAEGDREEKYQGQEDTPRRDAGAASASHISAQAGIVSGPDAARAERGGNVGSGRLPRSLVLPTLSPRGRAEEDDADGSSDESSYEEREW